MEGTKLEKYPRPRWGAGKGVGHGPRRIAGTLLYEEIHVAPRWGPRTRAGKVQQHPPRAFPAAAGVSEQQMAQSTMVI